MTEEEIGHAIIGAAIKVHSVVGPGLRSGVGDMASVAAGLPLKRMGQPAEVAEAVVSCQLIDSSRGRGSNDDGETGGE